MARSIETRVAKLETAGDGEAPDVVFLRDGGDGIPRDAAGNPADLDALHRRGDHVVIFTRITDADMVQIEADRIAARSGRP